MNDALPGFMIGVYSAALETVRRVLAPPGAPWRGRNGWNLDSRQRLPRVVRDRGPGSVVWVHAASLGEAKLLDRFLDLLEKRHPDDSYVVTAATAAGVAFLEGLARPSIHAAGFLPIDTLPLMRSLLTTFSVSRLWLIETELWPSMLWACFGLNVPVGIANGRIEEKSFAGYRRLSGVLAPLLRRLDIVLAQSETYAERFRRLGVAPDRLRVAGNLKSHIRVARPSEADRRGLRDALRIAPHDAVIAAGSMHAGEGALLREGLAALERRGRRCKCIVVPRYLDESDAIARELGGGVVILDGCASAAEWRICLIKKIGVLESVYAIADAAVVGGSFVDIGGHNLWEPARFGVPVFFGPRCFEQQEGRDALEAAGLGFCAADAAALAAGLDRTLGAGREEFAGAAARFADTVNRRQGQWEAFIP